MSRTYQELIDACTINYELFRGDISNRGTANMGASIIQGSPRFARFGKTVGLTAVPGTTAGFTSSTGTRIVDVTTQFVAEIAGTFGVLGQYVFYQVQGGGLGGGLVLYFNGGANLYLYTFTAVAGVARSITCIIPNPIAFVHHYVLWFDPVGLTGQVWIDNQPVITTFTNTNPPVNGVSGLYIMAAALSSVSLHQVRTWQGALDAAEVATLYNAYSTLRVPRKV
jgi:hypothetical protein